MTTDPTDPRLREHTPNGQQLTHLVLSEEERGRGYVRPLRLSYRHVGRSLCGDTSDPASSPAQEGKVWACAAQPGHDGPHGDVKRQVTPEEAAKGHAGGCGSVTTMSRAIAETYARDPAFYGATWCCGCQGYHPVGEYTWHPDGSIVGS